MLLIDRNKEINISKILFYDTLSEVQEIIGKNL